MSKKTTLLGVVVAVALIWLSVRTNIVITPCYGEQTTTRQAAQKDDAKGLVSSADNNDVGSLVAPLGPMCVSPKHVIIPVANASQKDHALCQLEDACAADANSSIMFPFNLANVPRWYKNEQKNAIVLWQADTGVYWKRDSTNQVTQVTEDWPPLSQLRFESGISILYDPCTGATQFGHTMTLLIRLAIMAEGGYISDHLVQFFPPEQRKDRWSSVSMDLLRKFLLEKVDLVSSARRELFDKPYYLVSSEFATNPTNSICFENVQVPPCTERFFRSRSDVQLFHSFIRSQLPWFEPTTESCPPPVAAVLYRSGKGAGLRKILDYRAVEDALKANGISKYVNITVAQDTPLEEAMKLFASFGLLLTTHSSQLKLLAFAHPDTVVVELRPVESVKFAEPFSQGPDVLGIHYFHHNAHKSGKCPMSADVCERKGNIYSDIWVNKTALTGVISDGLEKQQQRCNVSWT